MFNSISILVLSLVIVPTTRCIQLNKEILVNEFHYNQNAVIIDLYDKGIDSIVPGTFDEYRNLKYLYLDTNKLVKIEDKTFSNLVNLREIWLESNSIVSVKKDAFFNSTNLKLICISNNPISLILPQSLQVHCGSNPNCSLEIMEKCERKYSVDFKYLGCYNDPDLFQFPTDATYFDNLTIEVCASYCKNLNMPFLALRAGSECRCGKTFTNSDLLNSSECDIACLGNRREKCGGKLKNSVYQVKLENETAELVISYPCSKKSDTFYEFKRQAAFTIRLVIKPVLSNITSIEIRLGKLNFIVYDQFISLKNKEIDSLEISEYNPPSFNLLHFNCSENHIWISVFSLDRIKNDANFIKIGMGYVMDNNVVVKFVAKSKEGVNLLSSIKYVEIDKIVSVVEEICLINPFIRDYSPFVYESNLMNLNLEDLDKNLVTKFNLPIEGLNLYELIKNVQIEPSFAEAIDYSIENEGCSLNLKLKDKALSSFGSNDFRTSYLRIPTGPNYGNQPGQPFVLEIWPKGHYSPVHNHGETVAIIKMLTGSLKTEWYNPLSDIYNEIPKVVKTSYLQTGDITWMTPDHYQTHKLINENATRSAISIQAYAYTGTFGQYGYSESFNYVLPNDGELKKFYPTADYSITELKKIVFEEYMTKSCNN